MNCKKHVGYNWSSTCRDCWNITRKILLRGLQGQIDDITEAARGGHSAAAAKKRVAIKRRLRKQMRELYEFDIDLEK
jgi:hypothetical protein